jgi:hypothetical protein
MSWSFNPVRRPTPVKETELPSLSTLPYELRIMIWEALIEPRFVPVRAWGSWVISTRPIPIVLHVCHESRQVGLRFYKACISGEPWDAIYTDHPLYFNPSIDTLYLSSRFRMLFLPDQTLSRHELTHLNIEYHTFCKFLQETLPNRQGELIMKVCLVILKRLKSISLIFEDPRIFNKGDSDVKLVEITDSERQQSIRDKFDVALHLPTIAGISWPGIVDYKDMVLKSPTSKGKRN